MMELEDVKKGLSFAVTFFEARGAMATPGGAGKMLLLNCRNACETALSLLKEREPVKPVVAHDGWYRCGKCNNSLASGERVNCEGFLNHPWPLYCEMCGREVKWK